jgi:glutathione-regulated potassium-efflux system ancillary protein KefF
MADILILAAHPDLAQSRITSSLLHAVRNDADARVEIRDLYRLYPDYAVNVAAEQRALLSARLLVLLHPLHWYGMPALQKLWLDEVLRFGWAYGPGGDALQGKDLWLVSSTGGSAESYGASGHNEHPIEAFLLPYSQSAKLCGLRFLPPLLHSAHRADDGEVHRHASSFTERLRSYPAWCPPEPAVTPPEVPMDARPALFSSIAGEG